MFFDTIEAVFAGFFGSLWAKIFPAKTATDQKLSDATIQLKDAENAKEINDRIAGEDRADINHDLNKWVQ
jgi:hypothetical protein